MLEDRIWQVLSGQGFCNQTGTCPLLGQAFCRLGTSRETGQLVHRHGDGGVRTSWPKIQVHHPQQLQVEACVECALAACACHWSVRKEPSDETQHAAARPLASWRGAGCRELEFDSLPSLTALSAPTRLLPSEASSRTSENCHLLYVGNYKMKSIAAASLRGNSQGLGLVEPGVNAVKM